MPTGPGYLNLPSHPTCQECALGERTFLHNPGLPTRPWDDAPKERTKTKALLIVGSHPGVAEDKKGEIFIGATGQYTNRLYIAGGGLHQHADCYLTNAVRCAPRDRDDVGKTHLGRCRQYLVQDVGALRSVYDEVVILCTGEKAVMGVLGHKVSLRQFEQGQTCEVGSVRVRVFATFLATVLLPKRDPSKILAIQEHLLFLWRYLRDGDIQTKVELPRRLAGPRVPDPPANVRLLSLDIETYGCCRGYPVQTVFHPRKSLRFDKVARKDLVLTVGLSWRDPETKALCSKVYRCYRKDDLARLKSVLTQVKHKQILGQTVAFDVQYLWLFDPEFKEIIRPEDTRLFDLSVVNFLENDQRTERGLKNLSLILNVANYMGDPISLKKGERYASVRDPRLLRYQAKDTLATLLSYETLTEFIADRFGEETYKWGWYSRRWWHRLTWLALNMQWNGVKYDRSKLTVTHCRYTKARAFVEARTLEEFDVRLRGKGSGNDIKAAFQALVDNNLPDPEVTPAEYTKFVKRLERMKSGEWSTGKENLNLLLGRVASGPDRRLLLAIRRFRKFDKTVNTYTEVMLGLKPNRNKSYEGALLTSMAYPRWHPVPSYSEDSGHEGGTQQGRITSKDPATQTQPPKIEDCQISRYPGGAIIRADESQIELRAAAMWSGDQAFVDIFQTDANVHAATATLVAGRKVTKKGDPQWYHAGKTLNFLTLFSGGPGKFQETLLREVGLYLPLPACQKIISRFDREHAQFRKWQKYLVSRASKEGLLELPLTGISRTFLGDVEATYVPTIVNFPVQTIAAQITTSAMFEMEDWLRANKMRTLTIANTYDEGIYDVPATEVRAVCRKLEKYFRHPPLLADLVEEGLTCVPLDVEILGRYNDGRAFIWENGNVQMAA